MAKKKLNPLEDIVPASSINEKEMQSSCGEEEAVEEPISGDSPSPEVEVLMNTVSNPPRTKKPKTPSGRAAAVNPLKPKRSVKPKEKEARGSPVVKSGKKRKGGEASADMHVKRAKKVSGEDQKKISAAGRYAVASSDSESATDWDLNHSKLGSKKAITVVNEVPELPIEEKANEVKKKPMSHRLWSEEDEISLLQGMIDFQADTGDSPYVDMDGFYKFAMKSISFVASKNQFVEKIRKLKLKYMGKGKKSPKTYPKAHDNECLKLANIIWGSDGMALESAVKTNLKPKKSAKVVEKEKEVSSEKVEEDNKQVSNDGEKVEGEKVEEDKQVPVEEEKEVSLGVQTSEWLEKSFVVRSYAGLGVDEHFVKGKWSMVPMETKKGLEDKLKLVQARETELMLLKTDFMHELSTVIAETS